jgi:hypothetical protein
MLDYTNIVTDEVAIMSGYYSAMCFVTAHETMCIHAVQQQCERFRE